MRRDVRKQLLADYAVALVAERESWGRLHEPDLTEAQRCRTLAEWKQIAAGLRTLARQLRDAPVVALPLEPQAPESAQPRTLATEAPDEWEMEAAVAPVSAAATAVASRRPSQATCLAASLRLVSALRAKLETAVPRLGSL